MILRRFNAAGIDAFSQLLVKFRQKPEMELAIKLLEIDEYTIVVQPEIEVVEQQFRNRREAAEYLFELLKPLDAGEVASDAGLWTWLTLYFLIKFVRGWTENGSRRTITTTSLSPKTSAIFIDTYSLLHGGSSFPLPE